MRRKIFRYIVRDLFGVCEDCLLPVYLRYLWAIMFPIEYTIYKIKYKINSSKIFGFDTSRLCYTIQGQLFSDMFFIEIANIKENERLLLFKEDGILKVKKLPSGSATEHGM